MAWSDPAAARPMLDRIPLGKFAGNLCLLRAPSRQVPDKVVDTRMLEPEVEDVVEAVVFLLSEKSAMINGVVLPVDGGYCAT